jgi:hypothetical protein
MSTLEELGLGQDQTEIEIPDEVPEESSGYVPLPQPGEYVFQLPTDLSTVWAKLESKKGVRVSAGFTRENPLVITQDTKYDGYYKDYPLTTYINNIEYPRGREGVEVSDMYYLIRAFEASLPDEEKSALNNNASFVRALEKHAGKFFKARLSWRAYCNERKNIFIRIEDAEGNVTVEEQEGTPGCGASYSNYARDVNRRIPVGEDGLFKERFEEFEVHGDPDGCPASLICNGRLGRFATVTK